MENVKVIVGLGSCGLAAGAGKVYDKLKAAHDARIINFDLKKTSCIGMCYREPLVEIIDKSGSYLYGEVNEAKLEEILEKHIRNLEHMLIH